MKALFITLLLTISNLGTAYAQRVISFKGLSHLGDPYVETEYAYESIKEISIEPRYTYVTIRKIPKKSMKRMRFWYSRMTNISYGNYSIPLLGVESEDEEGYHSCSYDEGWGWSNVKKGKEYCFTLIFNGTIPLYVSNISLLDESEYEGGTEFKNIDLRDKSKRGSAYTDNDFDYHQAYIKSNVNFRTGPGIDYGIICQLKKNSQIIVDKSSLENDFYYVINPRGEQDGYVHKNYISFSKPIQRNNEQMFTARKRESGFEIDPVIHIKNKANRTLTLRVNNKNNKSKYTIKKNESIDIQVGKGQYFIHASSPGVRDWSGYEKLDNNYDYYWDFVIKEVPYSYKGGGLKYPAFK